MAVREYLFAILILAITGFLTPDAYAGPDEWHGQGWSETDFS